VLPAICASNDLQLQLLPTNKCDLTFVAQGQFHAVVAVPEVRLIRSANLPAWNPHPLRRRTRPIRSSGER
jgi:hypothetical protein